MAILHNISYNKLEQVLLLDAVKKHELEEVIAFYGEDFNRSELETDHEMFSQQKEVCQQCVILIKTYLRISMTL